jgi:hypothetical protein
MVLSKQIINGFIQTELELFKKQFDETFIDEIQDERSLAIAWVCYYFKDIIYIENSRNIIDFVDEVYERENYITHGWSRISALQAAAFILTSDVFYANCLIQHLDCGQSSARGFIIKSTGLICPLLHFDNKYLKIATENNIKHSHGYYTESTIILLLSKGTISEKLEWLNNQIKTVKHDSHLELYNKIISSNGLFPCGFFVSSFNKAKSYFIFKILSEPVLAVGQPELFDEIKITFDDLIALEKKHPLNDFYIDLDFLNNTN